MSPSRIGSIALGDPDAISGTGCQETSGEVCRLVHDGTEGPWTGSRKRPSSRRLPLDSAHRPTSEVCATLIDELAAQGSSFSALLEPQQLACNDAGAGSTHDDGVVVDVRHFPDSKGGQLRLPALDLFGALEPGDLVHQSSRSRQERSSLPLPLRRSLSSSRAAWTTPPPYWSVESCLTASNEVDACSCGSVPVRS